MTTGAFARLEALTRAAWIAVDTETTGTGPHDQVVEVAAVARDGEVVFESLVRPNRPVPATATAIHGLAEGQLESAAPWPEVWPGLQLLLLDHPVLAWNAAFDIRLIRQTCARYRLPFRLSEFVCLREAFAWRFPMSRATLAAACLALGIPERPAHRAKADAVVAREVALRLVKVDPLS